MPEGGSTDAIAAGAEHVLADVFRSLSDWFGAAGCEALFARAIVLSSRSHPVLMGVRNRLHDVPQLDRFAENAREYGSQATAEAATTVLASIITTLAGLIGEDITMRLLEEVPHRTLGTAPVIASGIAPDPAAPVSQGEAAS